jgi:hypothetical protein
VLWLREAARGGGERRQQEVRGLPAEMIVVCCCCMALSQPEPASVWIGPSLNEGVGNAYTRPIGGGGGGKNVVFGVQPYFRNVTTPKFTIQYYFVTKQHPAAIWEFLSLFVQKYGPNLFIYQQQRASALNPLTQ